MVETGSLHEDHGGKMCRLSMGHITLAKVKLLICSLSNSRSTAVDELDNFSVKTAAAVIAGPLHNPCPSCCIGSPAARSLPKVCI